MLGEGAAVLHFKLPPNFPKHLPIFNTHIASYYTILHLHFHNFLEEIFEPFLWHVSMPKMFIACTVHKVKAATEVCFKSKFAIMLLSTSYLLTSAFMTY